MLTMGPESLSDIRACSFSQDSLAEVGVLYQLTYHTDVWK